MSKTTIAHGKDQIVQKAAADACAVQDAVNLVASVTERLEQTGEIIGIPLIDHIIVAGENAISIQEWRLSHRDRATRLLFDERRSRSEL